MSRELTFDGYWEGEVEYDCDCCGKRARFRFDDEETAKDARHQRELMKKRGWIFTKVNDRYRDFCSEKCRNKYIRENTL